MNQAKKFRPRQPSLFESVHLDPIDRENFSAEWKRISRKTHGGDSKKQRKEYRPLARGKFVHLVMHSQKAIGSLSLLTPEHVSFIDRLTEDTSSRFGVKIEHLVNVGNHLHICLRFRDVDQFKKFLRAFSGTVARFVTKSKRGKPFGKFWDSLAYTRVLTSRREELQLRGYLEANRIEASRSKEAREQWLANFNSWVQGL